jgi:lipoprotein signal peptidase
MSNAFSRRDMRWLILAIAALVILLDRVTKLWIVEAHSIGACDRRDPKVFRTDACAQYRRGVQHV